MNKYILVFWVCFFVFNNGNAQTYHPFSSTTASWVYRYYDDFHNWTPCTIGFRMNGDTIIAGFTYKVIRTVGGGCLSFPAGYPFSKTYLRESAKRVYIITDTSSQEFLLFDFNAVANDTLHNLFPNDPMNCSTDNVVIDLVDSVLYGDGYHKYYYAENAQIIEGIGSVVGGIFLPSYCGLVSGTYVLECYSDSTEANIYPDGIGGGCLPLGLSEESPVNEITLSYTNPFHNNINIVMKDFFGQKEVIVYNALGKKMFNKAINNSTLEINTQEWDNGFYYLVFQGKGASKPLKLIKQ